MQRNMKEDKLFKTSINEVPLNYIYRVCEINCISVIKAKFDNIFNSELSVATYSSVSNCNLNQSMYIVTNLGRDMLEYLKYN